MYQFLSGSLFFACWAAGVFFLRFWKQTTDRLFLLFSMAFWLLGLERLVLAFINSNDEHQHQSYYLRLVAFVIIMLAIVDKNVGGGKNQSE